MVAAMLAVIEAKNVAGHHRPDTTPVAAPTAPRIVARLNVSATMHSSRAGRLVRHWTRRPSASRTGPNQLLSSSRTAQQLRRLLMLQELARRCPPPAGVRDHLIDNEPRGSGATDNHQSNAGGVS
ncbi:MAG: hypothetical protein F4Z34_04815 [Acidimicrobiaceae bacterium]|nr:hypothetical protein [Acidimicrobiaceae bacterium]